MLIFIACAHGLKGVSVPFLTSAISILNWLTLTPKTHFVFLYIFSPGAKTIMWHWGWGCNKKYIRKWKWVYRKLVQFQTSKVLWTWSWHFGVIMRKNICFHMIPKKTLFPVAPWGMRICDRHKDIWLCHADYRGMYVWVRVRWGVWGVWARACGVVCGVMDVFFVPVVFVLDFGLFWLFVVFFYGRSKIKFTQTHNAVFTGMYKT